MLGKTHMAIGIAASIAVTQPQTVSEMLLAVGGGAFGALICDIDAGMSESHQDADMIARMSVLVVLAVVASDFLLNTQIMARVIRESGYKQILVGALAFIGICAFGKEQPHRSFMHSFLALGLLGTALGLVCREAVVYFGVGFLSHLAVDVLNKQKVRLLYPMRGGVAFGLFRADGLANRVLLMAGSLAAVMEIVTFANRTLFRW